MISSALSPQKTVSFPFVAMVTSAHFHVKKKKDLDSNSIFQQNNVCGIILLGWN